MSNNKQQLRPIGGREIWYNKKLRNKKERKGKIIFPKNEVWSSEGKWHKPPSHQLMDQMNKNFFIQLTKLHYELFWLGEFNWSQSLSICFGEWGMTEEIGFGTLTSSWRSSIWRTDFTLHELRDRAFKFSVKHSYASLNKKSTKYGVLSNPLLLTGILFVSRARDLLRSYLPSAFYGVDFRFSPIGSFLFTDKLNMRKVQ